MTNATICATINGMKLWGIRQISRSLVIGITAVIIAAATLGTVANAIIGINEQNSPYPVALPTGNPDARHILIWSDHGKSTTLVLKLLYDPKRSAGPDDHVTIYDPAPTSTKCTLMDSITRDVVVMRAYANNGLLGQLGTGQTGILAKQMCEDGADDNYATAKGKIYGTSSFTFVVPAATINNTPPNMNGTGMKEVELTLQWNPDNNFPTPHNPVKNNGTIINSGEATVSFGVRSANGQLSGATTQEGRLNNSLVPRQGGSNDAMYVVYNFGLPCSEQNPGQETWRQLVLYDLDSSQTHFFVQEIDTGQSLDRASYGNFQAFKNGVATGGWAAWDAGNAQWNATNNSGIKLVGSVKMKADKKYRLVVTGLKHTSGLDDLFHNYVYVGVPGDVIYGESWFTCPTYKLPPSASALPMYVEPGEHVAASGAVGYEGNYDAGNHLWYVDRIKKVPGQADVPERVHTASENFPSGHSVDVSFDVPDNAVIGTKYCFVTTVIKWTIRSPDGEPHASSQACVTVGVKPKVQVWGYDLRVEGNIVASRPTLRGGLFYGSWAEYGAFTNKGVAQFMSASAISKGAAWTGGADWNRLTFPNTGGGFGLIDYPTATVKQLRDLCATGTGWSGNRNFSQQSDFSSQIMCVDGTATITGDIAAAPYGKQNVIVATGDINIKENVENVNAWLVAGAAKDDAGAPTAKAVNTCEVSTPAGLTASRCNKPLVVEGPIIANHMKLRRTTAPTATEPGKPAETFKTRADAFVWARTGGSSNANATARTVYVRELPPRF